MVWWKRRWPERVLGSVVCHQLGREEERAGWYKAYVRDRIA